MKGNIFTRKKVMACAISIVIAMVGMISLNTLPVEQYPDIAPPMVVITTDYTGADAATIMKSVVMPIEESVNGVQDMSYITSSASATGSVEISVYFKQGTDPDMAAVNVQNRVSKAMSLLPAEVTKVGVTVEKQQNSILQIGSLKSTDGKFDADFIANYIDINVKPRLMRIGGVGNVALIGNTYALRIWMKPDVMAQYELMPDDVFAAIGGQSFVSATGSLGESSENAYQYSMEYSGTLKTVEEFNDIVIRSSSDRLLHLSDVAEVELGAVSYNFSSSVDSEPGVIYIINQAAGANATQVNAEIAHMYEQLKPTMPTGLEFTVLMTSDDFLFAAIHNVVETLIIAILLVILVVYFFLQDFKATIIPSLSICVSLLGTFSIVQMAGFSLNILTLFALVLAIGTVVDDAIVVAEAVMAKLEEGGKTALQATREAMSEVTVAVISCTLVFMAVFIPVTFMPGTSGAFFTQFGITIACSVGLSCVSALTLCPALCVMMMKQKKEGEKQGKGIHYWTKRAYDASFNAILAGYKRSVEKFIARPWLACVLLGIACILFVFFASNLPSGLVPQEDQGVILCEIRTPEGTSLHESSEIIRRVEEKAKQIPELESYAVINGYGMISKAGSNYGTLIMRLKNWEERPGSEHYIDNIIASFYLSCEDIKNAIIIPFQMPQIPGYGNSNSIDLVVQDTNDGNMTEFSEHTAKFLQRLAECPEISDAMSSYSERYPKYKVEVNAAQCERSGVSPADVLNTLGAYCGGAYIGNYNQFGKVYRIMANASPEYRLDPASLQNIFVKVGNGRMAPISQFVSLKEIVGSASLSRFNLFNSISCSVNTANGYSEGQAHEAIARVFHEVMPSTYTYEYGSMSRELEETSKSNMTLLIYLVCVILIYLILGSLYDSWFVPFAVLFSVPFGLMGSFGFSWVGNLMGLHGMENNIYLQTGVIMLIGLLSKTAILITEFAAERRKQGLSIRDAAFQACEERLRPILMTVATMIIGMIPLIIEGGAGANGNRALALGVTGGMAIGTLALLYVVPCFFILFQTLHEKVQGIDNEDEKEDEE